jgi:hypothetical protein
MCKTNKIEELVRDWENKQESNLCETYADYFRKCVNLTTLPETFNTPLTW